MSDELDRIWKELLSMNLPGKTKENYGNLGPAKIRFKHHLLRYI
jgi:hypothetical protein